ncbi:MAG: HemK/PrmC family methyltransferase [Candidatus Dojkabacteria bacterium]
MRKFSVKETNHLIKHGFDPFKLTKEIDSEVPVEHITSKGEFYGRDFRVNKYTLIPRIETEELIDLALDVINNRANKYSKVTFADVATGSGIIGITFALELEKRLIAYDGYLSDISNAALKVAEDNARNFLIERKTHCFINQKDESSLQLIESDLLDNFHNIKLDLIVSNLPYIPRERISSLSSSVKDFEPLIALDGGIDGLEYIRKLLHQAAKFLNGKGTIILEVDDLHSKEKTDEFSAWSIEVRLDQNEKNRFWICTLL